MTNKTITFILGRSGSGKSNAVFDRISKSKEPALVLVPETFSHETERQLCEFCGNNVSAYAEVVTFRRLLSRTQPAGEPQPLDSSGRQLVTKLALSHVRDKLKSTFQTAKESVLLPMLLKTFDELQHGSVNADNLLSLSAMAADDNDTLTANKFFDLSLLLQAYEAESTHLQQTTRDPLTLLAEYLPSDDIVQGKHVYIDGFVTFTAAELNVLRVVFSQCQSLTIALTLDTDSQSAQNGLFDCTRGTMHQLTELAQSAGFTVAYIYPDKTSRFNNKTLTNLEQYTAEYQHSGEPINDKLESAHLKTYIANDTWQEAEIAAARIVQLVQQGARYRDIAVVARNIKSYNAAISALFARYAIPFFADNTTDILQKPILSALHSALETILYGYKYESIFAYLRSGLGGLPCEDIDILENYILRWQPRSWRSEWRMHPDGYTTDWCEAAHERLTHINTLRSLVYQPLSRLETAARAAKTAKEHILALYNFIEEQHWAELLENRAKLLHRNNETQLADETKQLWDILTRTLEQCYTVLGDSSMGLGEFAHLLKLALSHQNVGSIPISMDCVTIAGTDRIRKRNLKHIILLGCDETLTAPPDASGLLSEQDLVFLEEQGHNLTPTLEKRISRENFMLYAAVTLASDSVTLVIPTNEENAEHTMITNWINYFSLQRSTIDDLTPWRLGGSIAAVREFAAENNPIGAAAIQLLQQRGGHDDYIAALQQAHNLKRLPLSGEHVRGLYGMTLSASRLERWQSCRFRYFMERGLRIKPRPHSGFTAIDTGNFIHEIIEKVTRDVMNTDGFVNTDITDIIILAQQHTADYFDKILPADQRTRRTRAYITRLSYMGERIVVNIAEELKQSKFQPLFIEKEFRHSVHGVLDLYGIIDRVDGYERDGKLYLRFVDYKSGKKGFSLSELYQGYRLQLFLYTLGIQTLLNSPNAGVAGLLYTPTREVIAKTDKDYTKALQRSGMILSEFADDMDAARESFLPSKENDAFVLASLEQWGVMTSHIEKLLHELANDMRSGDIAACPVKHIGKTQSCNYCDYRNACQFDPSRGDSIKLVNKLPPDDVWVTLDAE